jgi:antitoxin component YwqK of YwqJK toxin-antitoxin module
MQGFSFSLFTHLHQRLRESLFCYSFGCIFLAFGCGFIPKFECMFRMKAGGLLLFCLWAQISVAQDPCSYDPASKKGGYWVFSTFYQPNTQLPLDGKCKQLNNGRPYVYRIFQKGRLVEEVLYNTENRLVSSLKMIDAPKDSTLGEFTSYWENGNLAVYEHYFLDHSGRRCMHRRTYHTNGKLRFDHFFSWVKASELTDYQLPYHPEHTIDDEGYSLLCVPYHRERTFDDSGSLMEEKYHQLLLDGSHEFSSLHGPYLRFHHNGKKQQEGTYKNGKFHGDWITFGFLGDTLECGQFDNGLKDGLWIYKHDNGKVKAEHRYDVKGKFPFSAQKKEWSPSGRLVLQFYFFENGTGVLKEWSEEGVLIHEQQLVNMSPEGGSETFWYLNGQIKSFLDNRPGADTLYQEWYENGRDKALKQIRSDGQGKRTEISEWWPNGNLRESTELFTGEFVQSFTRRAYYENGLPKYVNIQKNRERFIEEYASNGIKIRGLYYLDEKLHGKYQELDSMGQVRLEIQYKNGLRHGPYRYYSPSGELIYNASYEDGKWLSDKQKSKPYFQTFSHVDESVRNTFYSAAYYLLNRKMNENNQVRLSQAHVDSLAATVWQLNRIAPHYPDWVTAPVIGKQMLHLRLIESYFRDLEAGTAISRFSEELLVGLRKLNVVLPSYQFVQGEANVSISLEGFINRKYLNLLFPNLNSLMQLSNSSESDGEFVTYPRYSVSDYTASCRKVVLHSGQNNYTILLHDDGTAELENQVVPWYQFLEMDLSLPNLPYYKDAWPHE